RLWLRSLVLLHAPAAPEIYPLSLHDALPISAAGPARSKPGPAPHRRDGRGRSSAMAETLNRATDNDPLPFGPCCLRVRSGARRVDRKSTRLNSSHVKISYAVFCLKKKITTPT